MPVAVRLQRELFICSIRRVEEQRARRRRADQPAVAHRPMARHKVRQQQQSLVAVRRRRPPRAAWPVAHAAADANAALLPPTESRSASSVACHARGAPTLVRQQPSLVRRERRRRLARRRLPSRRAPRRRRRAAAWRAASPGGCASRTRARRRCQRRSARPAARRVVAAAVAVAQLERTQPRCVDARAPRHGASRHRRRPASHLHTAVRQRGVPGVNGAAQLGAAGAEGRSVGHHVLEDALPVHPSPVAAMCTAERWCH